jgi:hypothetical protein
VSIFCPVLVKMALGDEVIGLIKKHSRLVGPQNIMMCGATRRTTAKCSAAHRLLLMRSRQFKTQRESADGFVDEGAQGVFGRNTVPLRTIHRRLWLERSPLGISEWAGW